MQAFSLAVEYPGVVVTTAELESFEIIVDALADDGGLGEIKRCAGYRSDFAGRNETFFGR